MKQIVFDYILEVINQNECMGISYEEISEKFAINSKDFMEMVKDESWHYKLRPKITKDCIFFTKIN